LAQHSHPQDKDGTRGAPGGLSTSGARQAAGHLRIGHELPVFHSSEDRGAEETGRRLRKKCGRASSRTYLVMLVLPLHACQVARKAIRGIPLSRQHISRWHGGIPAARAGQSGRRLPLVPGGGGVGARPGGDARDVTPVGVRHRGAGRARGNPLGKPCGETCLNCPTARGLSRLAYLAA